MRGSTQGGPRRHTYLLVMETLRFPDTLVPAPTGPLTIDPRTPRGSDVHLSVVVPTYNEAKNIREMVERLTAVLSARFGDRYEIIVVDDASPDRTWEVALALTDTHPHLRIVRRLDERGLSTAVVRGWQLAHGDLLGVIDADLQHPPEVLARLCDQVEDGADLAVASRHVPGGGVGDWSVWRRIVSRVAQLIGLLVLPAVLGRVSDPMSGYFVVRRRALADVVLHPLGYKILIEVLGRGRVRRVDETPYVFRERADGESKATLRIYVEYLRHLLRLRVATLLQSRFLRFALVGLSGVFVDMLILYGLSDPATLGWNLVVSKVIAAEAAMLNNFAWNDAWTFRDLAGDQRSLAQRLKRLAKFNAICGMGLLLSVLLLKLQVDQLHLNRYFANAIAIVIVTAWNYWLNLKLSWRATQTSVAAPLAGEPASPQRAAPADRDQVA
jgi:dolichol-phosphate mannosyltransferase